MGHRFSKTAANNIAARTISTNENPLNTTTSTNVIQIPIASQQKYIGSKINLQIQGSPNTCTGSSSDTADSCINNPIIAAGILQQQKQSHLQQEQQQQQHPYNINNSISSSLTSVNNLSCGRQIIIKIQLAKMENGNELSSSLSKDQQQQLQQDTSFESLPADCNLNSTELSTTVTATATKFLNLTLNSNSNFKAMPNPNITTAIAKNVETKTTSSSASLFGTAGSSLKQNNNYLNSNIGSTSDTSSHSIMSTSRINERSERLNTLEFNDEIVEQNIGEIVEYCEVLECNNPKSQTSSNSCNNSMQMLSINEVIETDNEINVCCRRKSKSLATNGGSSMSSSNNVGIKSKSRCRKCSCRDAFRRFLDPSLSRSSNKVGKQQKEQKHNKSQDRHSINNPILKNTNKQQQHRNSMHSTIVSTSTTRPITVATTAAIVVPPAITNPVSLWSSTTNDGNDVIIPITTPAPSQFVVVQCAIVNPSNAALHSLSTSNTTSNTSLSTKNLMSVPAQDISSPTSTSTTSNDSMVKVPLNSTSSAAPSAGTTGPIVHSQVDFVHYLVPDLERITNSSFYWGKMDRYEAERLLEGKPEGTFLLRDSAQEEFLFSVTFRKYGRSLHARIEQSDHRFSFDCHDPCVFTASTVTGLLEHYKDPACVMFFEPMLTIPLHRKNCFSLQKLCRATIVSNTTYDGINELELPARMKSYLKEYHYKQKLRVKSNEPTYTLQCK